MSRWVQGDYAKRKGYDEFIAALKKINAENPSCIKVGGLTASENNGYMTLTATINFYGTSLRNRISVDDSKAPYTYWCGNTNVDTKGGFIGFPYVCDNENSLWYGVVNMGADSMRTSHLLHIGQIHCSRHSLVKLMMISESLSVSDLLLKSL